MPLCYELDLTPLDIIEKVSHAPAVCLGIFLCFVDAGSVVSSVFTCIEQLCISLFLSVKNTVDCVCCLCVCMSACVCVCVCVSLFYVLFTRAILKGLAFGLCLYVLRLCNVHVLYRIQLELVKSPEVTLCGWLGYKPARNQSINKFFLSLQSTCPHSETSRCLSLSLSLPLRRTTTSPSSSA